MPVLAGSFNDETVLEYFAQKVSIYKPNFRIFKKFVIKKVIVHFCLKLDVNTG